jgi:hypothetical protein
MGTQNGSGQEDLNRAGKRRIVEVILCFLLSGTLLFVSAGRLDWTEAWIYLGIGIFFAVIGSVQVIGKNPAVNNERGRHSEKTKGWDKVFGAVTVPLIFRCFDCGIVLRQNRFRRPHPAKRTSRIQGIFGASSLQVDSGDMVSGSLRNGQSDVE